MTTPPITAVSAVLLVDQRIQNYENIVSAVKDDVRCIVFEPNQVAETCRQQSITSFQYILNKITELGVSSFANIGIVQHNSKESYHQFFGLNPTELSTVTGVEASDPTLQTWAGFAGFITTLKTTYGIQKADLMACALYSNPNWKYIIDTLATQTAVEIRASTDDTGAAALGGNWFLESHTGVNLKGIYFTDAIDAYKGLLRNVLFKMRQNQSKSISSGNVVAWGGEWMGGSTTDVNNKLTSGVIAIYSVNEGFAALKTNGSIVTWRGDSSSVSSSIASGVIAVYSTQYDFAALKTNGSVITWGNNSSANSSSVSSSLSSGVVGLYSTDNAFAALKSDGSLITWGDSGSGGNSSSVSSSLASGVVAVYSTNVAFAALKSNGSVVTWGSSTTGGDSSSVSSSLTSGVVSIYSTISAFAALKSDGRVVTWGNSNYGGNSSSVSTDLSAGVVTIYSTQRAFTALKTNGSLVTWGVWDNGWSGSTLTNVVMVYSTDEAFAALITDGSVVTWGRMTAGGDSTGVISSISSGVVAIYSTRFAFAALKSDGSVVTWGHHNGGNSSSVSSSLTSGVVAVYSSAHMFAAIKNDGSVITWGFYYYGGPYASSVDLSTGAVAIYSAGYASAAIKTTATTFDLSMSYYTDLDRFDILRQKENRRRVDLTNLNNNVFTLSQTRDLQIINPNIPSGKTLRIIVPTYTASSYSITSTATIPGGGADFIIACNEGEPVTISGVNYVNYGSYIYKRESNNTYTKITSASIGGNVYNVYGGDGINSSGIALIFDSIVFISAPSYGTFTPPAKTFGAASFSMVSYAPTSNSSGAYTYTSSAPGVATISSDGTVVTVVSAGSTTITVSQVADGNYSAGSQTGVFTVSGATPTYTPASPSASVTKTFGVDISFSLTSLVAGISNSSGAYTFSSGSGAVSISDGVATIVAYTPSAITITASQDASGNYASGSTAISVLINRGTPTYQSVAQISKTYGTDISFSLAAVMSGISNSNGAYTFSSASNAISFSGSVVTILGYSASTISILASQDASGNYNASSTTISLVVAAATPTFQSVAQITKTFSTDVSFSMTPIVAGMSNSDGAYIFTRSGAAVDAISISGDVVTILAYTPSAVNIDVYQEASGNYTYKSGTISLLVARKVPTYGAFTIPAVTYSPDGSFSIVQYAPTTDSTGVALTYSSSATSVATISSDGTLVTIVGHGSATITASQVANGNYAAGSATSVFVVNRAAPTFLKAFTITDKTFGDAPFSLMPFTDGLDNTDGTYHFSSSDSSIVSISTVDNVTATILAYTPSPITITVDIDACGNYAAATTSGTLTVARVAPTYQSVPQVAKTYGVDVSFSLTAVMAGISNSSGAYTFTSDSSAVTVSGSVATIQAYTPSAITITATQAASGNYAASSKTFTVLVSRGAPTYQTVSQVAKTYGVDVSFSLADVMSGISNSDGAYTFSGGSGVISISSDVATIMAYTPSAITLTATQDASGNYAASSKTFTLLVSRGPPTYQSVTQVAKTFGVDVSFSMTALVAGISNSSGAYTFSSESGAVSISGAIVTILAYTPSAITITATQAADGNYAASSANVSLLVSIGTPTLSNFDNVNKLYGISPFVLTPPTSNSSGAFTYTSSNTSVATITNATVTIIGSGTSTITATQDASGNYQSGTISSTLTVTNPTPTYQTVSQISKTYGTDVSFSLTDIMVGVSNSSGAYTFSSDSGAISISGAVVTILAYTPSEVSITASQAAAGDYNAGSATLSLLVSRATPTYQSVAQITKTYGVDVSFSLASVVAGISNSDGAYSLFSSASGAVSFSGDVVTILAYTSSAITITASQDASGNYAASSKAISLLVNRGPPTYQSVSQIAKTYGTDVSFSMTDVMVGVSNSSGAYTFSSAASEISVSGDVVTILAYTPSAITITATQAAAGNYTSSSATVTLLVDRKVPSYGAFTLSAVTYEDAPYSLVSNAPTSESNATYSYTSSNSAVATVNSDGTVVTVIGQGYTTITASQDISGNYAAGSTTASLLVNRAAPTFLKAFTIDNKTFGDAPFSLLPFTVGLDNTDGTYHFSSSDTSVVTISEVDGVTATILAYTASTPVTIYVAIDACGNYAASTTSGTLTINRKVPAYQSVSTVAKTFGDAAFSLVDYMSGISESSGSYTFASSDVSSVRIESDGVTATILAYKSSAITITATQAASGNYAAGAKTFSMTVARVAPTIGALALGSLNGYYDVSDGFFTLTAPTSNSSGGFTYSSDNSAVAMVVNTNNVSFVGNGTANIIATQDICGNYATGSVSSLLRLGATVPTFGTFTVSSTTKTYGDGPFTLTPPTSNSDGAFTFTSDNSSRISISGTTATIVGGGQVNITASQAPSGSFTRKSVTTTFTVQRKNPSLSNFPAIVKTYSDSAFTVTAPVTDGYNYFTYSSSNTGVVSRSESDMYLFLINNGGSATITATSIETDNYASGAITATVTINPSLPYIGYGNSTRAFDIGTFSTIYSSQSDGAVTFVSSDTSVATISGAVVTIKKVGVTTITLNSAATSKYLTRSVSAVFTVTPGTPTISNLYNETRTMTQAPFTLSPTSTSTGTFTYVSDNSAIVFITNSGTTFNVAGLGDATITATISEDPSGNYNSRNYSFTMSVIRATSSISSNAFAVPVFMTYGDTPVNIITAPTSDSSGAITYTSNNVNIATIHPTTGLITAVGAGWNYFVASQAQTNVHYASTVQSNYMQFVSKSVTQTRVAPYTSSTITKYYGDASFQLSTVSESTASKLFTTNVAGVINISTSSNIGYIEIVNVGTVVITGQQFANSQYSTQNNLTWTLTVEKGSTALTGLAATLSKNVTDAPFTLAVSSASAGVKSYALSNPDSSNVLVVNSSTGVVTLKGAGTATIVASQAASSLYNAPSSVSCVVTVAAAGTSLQGSTITSARTFDNVDMTGASLSGTTVTGVSFAGATMTNAVLTGATVRNATLTSTNMVDATLTNTDISGTSFAGATMTRVIMTGATLTNSTLTSADLSGASMANTTITGATFTSSTMTNAVLTGATLTNSTLTSAVLTGASLVGANVTSSTFVGASLAGADLSGATVTNANFTNANISGADITNVAFSSLQKIQLLKNTNNRAIGGIQVGDISGSVVLAAISGTSPAASIPNIATADIKVVIPTTSTVASDTLPNVVLDTTTSDKFYFPINEGEYFQILGVKYYTDGGIVRNYVTNDVVEVISYGNRSIWLIAGSIIASVLAVNTISASTFTVPSGKLDTDASFNITVAPTSNSDAPIVYSSNHTSVATIHPSTGIITIVSQGYVSFTATQAATLLYEAGSKTSNELHVDKLINFTLSGLNQTILMSTSGLLDASSVSLETTDATAVFYVKLSDMTDIFKYQTDSFDMTENDASDVKYYVFNRSWPAALKINPVHAMMNKTESDGMLGTTDIFTENKMLAKHDFLRYLSLKLFNTIHGVDLFNNESDLLENATYWGEDVRTNIRNILTGISTTSSDGTMSYDASGNKYLTNATTSNTNLCRELVRQLLAGASSRFGSINDVNLPQGIPLIENDTINFKITFNSAPSQNLLTGVTEIPSRSYMVKLVMKTSITGLNTPVVDSEMYPNAYPYSSSVVSYAPTESSSAVYNIYSSPAPMPFAKFGFDGWYYTNSTAWVTSAARDHVKWLLPANSGSSTVGSLLYIRVNLKIHNKVALPYIMVYTTSNSSRKYPVSNTGALANGGVYSFYMNFNSYTVQPAMIGYTNAALANTTGSGSFATNEGILNIALETDSSAAAGTVDFTLSSIIVGDASGEKEYGFEAAVPTAYP